MVQQMAQLTNCWRSSSSLWIDFVRLAYSRAINFRSPLKVDGSELLGRALFSGHIKKGKVLASAFMPKRSSRKLSINRLSCAQKEVFIFLSTQDAINRSNNSGNNISFYGFAEFEAKKLRSIKLDTGNSLDVRGSPSIRNALHADIGLPEYEGKSYDLLIADQLIEISTFESIKNEQSGTD